MHHLILNRSMAPSTMSRAQQLLSGLQASSGSFIEQAPVHEKDKIYLVFPRDVTVSSADPDPTYHLNAYPDPDPA